MSDAIRDEVASSVNMEAARLRAIVQTLEAALARATVERAIVSDWPATRLDDARRGLRQPRFADVEGLSAELERARAEVAALDEIRHRLSG